MNDVQFRLAHELAVHRSLTLDEFRARTLRFYGSFQLRELIADERERGRAFGPLAEAARLELARRA